MELPLEESEFMSIMTERMAIIQDLYKVVSELRSESKQYQDQVNNLSGELKTVKVRLDETSNSTNQIANRLIGVENTFTTSFTVDGSIHYY